MDNQETGFVDKFAITMVALSPVIYGFMIGFILCAFVAKGCNTEICPKRQFVESQPNSVVDKEAILKKLKIGYRFFANGNHTPREIEVSKIVMKKLEKDGKRPLLVCRMVASRFRADTIQSNEGMGFSLETLDKLRANRNNKKKKLDQVFLCRKTKELTINPIAVGFYEDGQLAALLR